MPLYREVSPTNSLFFLKNEPCPCEQQTAALINKIKVSMLAGDVRAVSYRYLQICAGERNTFIELSLSASIALLVLYNLLDQLTGLMDEERNLVHRLLVTPLLLLFLASVLPAATFNAVPNTCNTLRYGQVRKESATWLESRLGREVFLQIKDTPYNTSGCLKVKQLLDDQNIPEARLPIPEKFATLPETAATIHRSHSW